MKLVKTLGIATAISTAAVAANAENVNVVYAAYGAPTTTLVEFGIVPFLEMAKENSGGTIDYTLHSGGSLLGAKAMLEGVRDGVVDGGQILGVYNPSELPISNIAMGLAPIMSGDNRIMVTAITDFVLNGCPDCKAEMEENNIQFLGGFVTSPYAVLCSKPVATLADLKGRKARASGEWGILASHLGMTPVTMGIGETYEALQRGQVDCTMGGVNWLTTFSFGDVAPNVLALNQGISYGGPILSLRLDLWETLTDEQKKAFTDAAASAMVMEANAYAAADDDVMAIAEEKSYNIVQPGEDIQARLGEFTPVVREALLKRSTERGIENADEIIDSFLAYVDKWREIISDNPDDAAVVDAIKTNIFANMKM